MKSTKVTALLEAIDGIAPLINGDSNSLLGWEDELIALQNAADALRHEADDLATLRAENAKLRAALLSSCIRTCRPSHRERGITRRAGRTEQGGIWLSRHWQA